MGANIITITKGKKEAQIVETSLSVWEAKGWKKKAESKSTPQKTTAPSGDSK